MRRRRGARGGPVGADAQNARPPSAGGGSDPRTASTAFRPQGQTRPGEGPPRLRTGAPAPQASRGWTPRTASDAGPRCLLAEEETAAAGGGARRLAGRQARGWRG